MTTGPAAQRARGGGQRFLLAGQAAGGDVDLAERVHRPAADLGFAHAPRRHADHGRVVSHARQGLRGGLRVHARPDPQSRRIGVALVLHAAAGTLRAIARGLGRFSLATFLGADGKYKIDPVDRRLGRVCRPAMAAQVLLYLSAAFGLRGPAQRAGKRGRRCGNRRTG